MCLQRCVYERSQTIWSCFLLLLLFFHIFEFLASAKFIGCFVFLCVFHSKGAVSLEVIMPIFHWVLRNCTPFKHNSQHMALVNAVPVHLDSRRWPQSMNCFSKKKKNHWSLIIWPLVTVMCNKTIISVFHVCYTKKSSDE